MGKQLNPASHLCGVIGLACPGLPASPVCALSSGPHLYLDRNGPTPTFPFFSFSFLPHGMLSGRAHLEKQGSSQLFRATVFGFPSPFLWELQVKFIEDSVDATLSTFPMWGLLIAIHPSQHHARTTCLQSRSAVPDTSLSLVPFSTTFLKAPAIL